MAVTASQTSGEIDWYVITDEADLTLRIANGLRMGEDRWGELTLNHPVAAHRWLEFTIEEDGQLSARPSRRDVVIEVDGEPQAELLLQSGDPIELPHNRVHISDSFKRGPSDAPPAVVRCIEVDTADFDKVPTLAQMVVTESDLAPVNTSTSTATESAAPAPVNRSVNAPRSPGAAINQAIDPAAISGNTPSGESQQAEPRISMADMMANKLAQKVAAHSPNQSPIISEEESIETALIPVDAESPFAPSEVSEALKRPIEVAETPDTRGAANSPVITPALTETAPAERRSYTYLWALSAILGIGILAAIVTAISSVPERTSGRPDPVTVPTTVVPPTRTEALLASVQNILSRSGPEDPAAWEFAVRSYEYILAQEPNNDVVRRRLNAARSKVALLRAREAAAPSTAVAATDSSVQATGEAASAAAPAAAEPPPASAQSAQPAAETQPAEPARPFVLDTDVVASQPLGNTEQDAVTLPIAATANVEPLTEQQIEQRLRLAARRLEDGQIIAPRGSSASALVLSVLAVDPTHRQAINLLNAAADVMVTRAEQAFASGNSFGARNTLEEVLAFHPRHPRANARWLEWTGSPSRYR